MLQNHVRDHAQDRNPQQAHHSTQDHDPIRPNVSGNTGPKGDHGTPDHSDRHANRSQEEYVAGPTQGAALA